MPDISSNLGLNLPKGSDTFDYDVFLRQNFQKIDDQLKANITETFTASAGQTVVTLVHSYIPGAGALSVEVDGVPQYVGSGYTETDSNTITFTEGLNSGAPIKVTILGLVPANDERFNGIESSLADKTQQLISFVSVLKYGADPTGVNDSTQSFKNAVDYARSTVINSNFKTVVVVLVPGGIYKISDQIRVSHFVPLRMQGFVLINSSVAGKSTLWIAPQNGDPTFLDIMSKTQYARTPVVEGGLLIKSTLDRSTSGAIGLEIGSQSELSRQSGRYSIKDVAIDGFDVGIQMNVFNNYIGQFYNLHLEVNNTNVRFGSSTMTSGSNSGENISFYGSVFAGAANCFDWYIAGFSSNFYGCSFDFNTTLFYFRKGYRKVSVYGGHIESVTTIADGTSNTDSDKPSVYLNNPVVYCDNYPLFKGTIYLFADNVKWQRVGSSLNSFLYLCDNNVNAREINHMMQGGFDVALSPKLNRINNSKFQSANLTSGDAVAPFNEFTISSGSFGTPVVTATIPTGSSYTRALKAISSASGSFLTVNTNSYPCKTGDVIQTGAVTYIQGADVRNISMKVDFLDVLGNVISTSNAYANKTGATPNTWNTFFSTNNLVAPAGTASVKMYCTVSALISGETAYIGELFLGIS